LTMSIRPHRIAVGSQNPTKVASVTHVVHRLWPGVEVVAVEAPSGVAVQPTSDEDVIRGVRNRTFLEGWAVVVDRQGTVGYLTNGLVTRVTAQENTVAYTLARFLQPELYEQEHSCHEPER
jgi:non-canonical (house-cleaning) NTP pyrophosphatase